MNDRTASSLLLDPHASLILKATFGRPVSIQEICLKYDIPVAVCCSLIDKMEKAGFLRVMEKLPLPGGLVIKTYRAAIKSITLRLVEGDINVSTTTRKGPMIVDHPNP
ncbi:MAG: hypothetical protein U9R75_06805 [Candidatus Thermoplasmatota archaeon]|nr:hypothetical protein [Candidatus Thermoplasmatota archaeon]